MPDSSPRIRRWSLFATWSAWRAVRAGVPLMQFLAFRSAKYQARLVGTDCLAPVYLDLGHREQVRESDHALGRFLTDPERLCDTDPAKSRLAQMRPLEPSPTAYIACREDLTETEADAKEVRTRIDALKAERDRLESDLREGVKSGEFTTRLLEKLWARRLRFVFVSVSIFLAFQLRVTLPVVGFISTEAMQLVYLMFNMVGVNVGIIQDEWVKNPVGVVSGFGLAAVAAVGIVILADWLFELLVAAHRDWQPRTQDIARLMLAAMVTAFVGATVWYLADVRWDFINQRPRSTEDAAADLRTAWALIFVSYLLPLTAGYLIHQGRRAWAAVQARRAALHAARAPGDARTLASMRVREATRLAGRCLERERAIELRCERRRSVLRERLAIAEENIRSTIDRHLAVACRLAQLLALDEYAFGRRAYRAKRMDLLAIPAAMLDEHETPNDESSVPSIGPESDGGAPTP